MKIMKPFALSWLVLLSSLAPAWPAATRTDLAKDIYVEASPSDFKLEVATAPASSKHVRAYHLTPPTKGSFTLLCFVNGKLWRLERVELPGVYRISTRGLAPGEHRITLQAVAKDGQLGCYTKTLNVPR